MAKLINGNGNPAVYANEDSDWFAAIMGNQTSITAIGEQFRADQADANTIEVFDGVIITKEGRRIQLDANQVDLFEIPTGTQGQTNYYIIGYHLYTDTDSNQFCEVFVQLMESASDTIPEDTFRGGADDVYISLYRVTQDGLNIDSIDLLLPTISTISGIYANLTDNNKSFNFGYDPDTGKYGYYKQEGGADTFYPFSSGDLEVSVVEDALQSTTIALDIGAIYLALYATGNQGTGELKFNSGATLLHEVYIASYTPSGTGVSCYCRIYMATSDQGVLNSKTTRITDTGSGRKLYKINVSSS